MTEDNQDVSRRSVLKQAAAGGVGFVAGGSILAGLGGEQARAAVEQVEAKKEWLAERAYCLSGNKVLKTTDGVAIPATTLARQVYRPRSAQEIAELVKASPATVPIASVCGGHESSNAALLSFGNWWRRSRVVEAPCRWVRGRMSEWLATSSTAG
jgi:hypothetical protein